MITIWKYTVPVTDSTGFIVKDAKLICVLSAALTPNTDPRKHEIDIWVVVDRSQITEPLTVPIEIRGTGNPLFEVGDFIGTVRDGDFLVWHVFTGADFKGWKVANYG
ncbi:hypothetical protein SEA_FORZA_25 [Gordonia phage Forza]|uniref:DUF7352 domain-containing protein n=1 Tax=Gordonia phage Forza TaxID=2571247 RepID=A0A650EZD0_9CAUD|nr:hypothetical protein PP303_gp025 [Gordonia phage Forza]QEM41494.1 hypothetical protein SEA_BOOPY_25 [Gordonia phage Boopy]QGT55018.1 hypothetical protein SEA_FORZA_25 [Gordonia phage Forza]UXE04167.1 hypothetical protein SEA_BLUENGOLD_23 [Gordonia phage BlueNGold]WBF03806.1 hypothetical protein SEA_MAREELIH_23 [Gordonia phage Mareelih]